jgi:hypothetical protein
MVHIYISSYVGGIGRLVVWGQMSQKEWDPTWKVTKEKGLEAWLKWQVWALSSIRNTITPQKDELYELLLKVRLAIQCGEHHTSLDQSFSWKWLKTYTESPAQPNTAYKEGTADNWLKVNGFTYFSDWA